MATWGEFVNRRPDLAAPGRAILYQFGVGLAFLGTVRPDGGPRVHPMCPVVVGDHLTGMLVPSPKRRDLQRDPRYTLHSFPCPDNEDAFSLAGTAAAIDDEALASAVRETFKFERAHHELDPARLAADQPFEFELTSALLTVTKGHGDWEPQHRVWHDAGR